MTVFSFLQMFTLELIILFNTVWMIKECQIFISNKMSQQEKISKSLTSD